MPVYCLARLAGNPTLIGLSTAFTAISLFAFSLGYCVETRGLRRSALMVLSAFAIALTMEYLGSEHGVLFGHYDYTDNLGPRALGKVPIIIPIAWFMMLYPAWVTAGTLVERALARASVHASVCAIPSAGRSALRIVVAALAMTAWDLSLDPRMVADGNWIWRDGGAYFGIPLSNYLGWFVTAALICGTWALMRVECFTHAPTEASSKALFWTIKHAHLPVWAYVVTWLGESVANIAFWGGPAIAASVFVGMGVFAAPALVLLRRNSTEASDCGAPQSDERQPACSS